MLRKTLVVCGILSSLLYAVMTAFIATLWPDYSPASHGITESRNQIKSLVVS